VGRGTLDDADTKAVAFMGDKIGGDSADFKFEDLLIGFVSADAFRYRQE